jgi:hypothetical protein
MRQTYLFAAAVAALILACVAGWATSDTQARVATPSVQIDPIQMMESATCVENPQYRLEQATCPCWTFPSSVLASFRASSTASPRMYAVTDRPAARARRVSRSMS